MQSVLRKYNRAEMNTAVIDGELNEGGSRRIRRGCTIGRVINLCMTLDFFLVMITALIVSGTLGAVNLHVCTHSINTRASAFSDACKNRAQ